MKIVYVLFTGILSIAFCAGSVAQSTSKSNTSPNSKPHSGNEKLFMDVHRFEPGKVTYQGVAEAHAKDLAVQKKYGVHFLKFWVDEDKGLVYCLSSASDSESIRKTHAEAHGLLPESIYLVTDGPEAKIKNPNNLYLDMHEVGPNSVTKEAVAGAHEKDLATQAKYGANFINYWLDTKDGVIFCLVEAKDSSALINTHKEAHGLLPNTVMKVKQGK